MEQDRIKVNELIAKRNELDKQIKEIIIGMSEGIIFVALNRRWEMVTSKSRATI